MADMDIDMDLDLGVSEDFTVQEVLPGADLSVRLSNHSWVILHSD